MKTIGTLEEIGAQVGDVVECYRWDGFIFKANKPYPVTQDFLGDVGGLGRWRIVTRAAKSPVRTVTRKEIVPGIYGRLQVSSDGYHAVNISAKDPGISWSASDLTAAIKTLTEIRDAMENP